MKKQDTEEQLEHAVATVERRVKIVSAVTVTLIAAGAAVGAISVARFSGSADGLAILGGMLQGTTGVLWSLAGLMLVYVAFLGQQLAILHQKEDLRLTREALKDQRREMETQTELFDNQQFETTFFTLLSSHQELVTNSEIETADGTKRGPSAFAAVLARLRARFVAAREAAPDADSLETAKQCYLEEFLQFEQTLGPYFHSLFHILKFVDTRPLPIDRAPERRRYTNYVRARLSYSELVLLFYSGISHTGAGMKALIERYAVLKHLSTRRLLDRGHRMAYKFTAWARPMTGKPSDLTEQHRARRKRRLDAIEEVVSIDATETMEEGAGVAEPEARADRPPETDGVEPLSSTSRPADG